MKSVTKAISQIVLQAMTANGDTIRLIAIIVVTTVAAVAYKLI